MKLEWEAAVALASSLRERPVRRVDLVALVLMVDINAPEYEFRGSENTVFRMHPVWDVE